MADSRSGPERSAPTIYDVARECGVAASTVSRAFARPGRVNAATAARIRQAADRLGYRTNPLARVSPTGKTGLIALLVGDITNPVNFEIIRGGESAAAKAGFTLVLGDAQESARTEREAIQRASPTVEGLILSSSRMSDSAIRMAAKQRPVVIVNRAFGDLPSVVTDNVRGMRRAAEHLRELGHVDMTYIAGPEASWPDGMRWHALREASAELGMRVRRLGPVAPTVAGGMAAVAAVRRAPTTALVAYNDLIAIGLMRGLANAGIAVPAEVSVVGFDNIFGADFPSPPLTTLAAPLRAMGASAVEHLVAQLGGAAPRTGGPVVLPVRLVVRGSTGPRSPNGSRVIADRATGSHTTARVPTSATSPSR